MISHTLLHHKQRLYNDFPVIGGWLRNRAARYLARDRSAGAVQILAEAVAENHDAGVREIAVSALRGLTAARLINAACQVWAEKRYPALTDILLEQGWVATAPPSARVLTALKQDKGELLAKGAASLVEPLAEACTDADPEIAARAQAVLARLGTKELQEALCRLIVERPVPLVETIALQAGYLPEETQERALYLFMTGQWDRYEALDYDRRLLRAAYAAASPGVQARVREKMRLAGRADFLTAITGADYSERIKDMAADEFDLLAQTLIAHREWARLWRLLFEMPYGWSRRIVEQLHDVGWQPDAEDERQLLADLVALVGQGLPRDEVQIAAAFPPALLRAQARVPGRVNDVAFAERRPVIAVGTGQRKIAVWNYQQGQVERVVGLPDHSVGCVAFVQDGTLVVGERARQSSVPCGLYVWRLDELKSPVQLGAHVGSVTALAPVGRDHLLSAGRDRVVLLWDVRDMSQVARREFPFWARAMRVSGDGSEAALLHRGLHLVSLPDLMTLSGEGNLSVAHTADFAPDGETLLVGLYNGAVLWYQIQAGNRLTRFDTPFVRADSRVVGVESLTTRNVVLIAWANGDMSFVWMGNEFQSERLKAAASDLTSISVSPDEAFLVTGDSYSSLQFYDLRTLDMRRLLTEPFARAKVQDLTSLSALMEAEELPAPGRRALQFARRVLQRRFRFDIEIGSAPTIMTGEFDIEIESGWS